MRILSGIQPSGALHIGNYFGAIRQYVELQEGNDAFYFVADYHALTSVRDPAKLRQYVFDVIVDLLALGLDPEVATLFVQSDVPETTELAWLLTTVTPMSWLEKCVSYKDKVQQGHSADHGLFAYPILQAADILLYDADLVPVGQDQKQHLEITRDVAERFNHIYGDVFKLPKPHILQSVAVVPGVDGRKMSKSYDNTVPLFEGGAKSLRDALAKVVTDSRLPGEPKDADSSHLVAIFEAFASDAERVAFRSELQAGMGWGDAKAHVVGRIERDLAPLRARYADLMAHPERIEETLLEGARKARKVAAPFLTELRDAVGLRRMVAVAAPVFAEKVKVAMPSFKQYREAGGKFYFKLAAADGRVLLQSAAFESGRDAGQWIARLKNEGVAAIPDAPVAHGEGVSAQDVADALAALALQLQ